MFNCWQLQKKKKKKSFSNTPSILQYHFNTVMTTMLLLGSGWHDISSINFSGAGLGLMLQGMDTFSKNMMWDWWESHAWRCLFHPPLRKRRSLLVRVAVLWKWLWATPWTCGLCLWIKAVHFSRISCRQVNSHGCHIAPRTLQSSVNLWLIS